jgi:hypothetical protein
MNKYTKCINYLAHKKTDSLDKLIKVYNILRNWECKEDICFAGLLHSVYPNLETDREVIKKLVGTEAESYIHQLAPDKEQNKGCRIINLARRLSEPMLLIKDDYYDLKDIEDFYFYFKFTVPWRFLGHDKQSSVDWRKFVYPIYGYSGEKIIVASSNFKNKLEKRLKKYTENLLSHHNLLDRCYASASPYGTVHETHTDVVGFQKSLTVMYYLNSTWDSHYGGETVFFDDLKKEIIKSIIPKPGRVIIFDGGYQHSARETIRNFNDLRLVITFKYNIKL